MSEGGEDLTSAGGVGSPELNQPRRAERLSHVARVWEPSKKRSRSVLEEDSLVICVPIVNTVSSVTILSVRGDAYRWGR